MQTHKTRIRTVVVGVDQSYLVQRIDQIRIETSGFDEVIVRSRPAQFAGHRILRGQFVKRSTWGSCVTNPVLA